MNYKMEDTLKLHIPDQFGSFEDNEPSDEMAIVFNQLDPSVKTNWGASQFVIISDSWDKVIKIPLTGMYDYYEDDDEYYFDTYYADYCAITVDLYEQALAKGVAAIFAETAVFGKTSEGKTIYIQEKIATPHANPNIKCNKDSLELAREKFNWCQFNLSWLANAIDYYGFSFVDNFLNFCYDNDIKDLHNDNYGYREDGSPVVFDYAGFDW